MKKTSKILSLLLCFALLLCSLSVIALAEGENSDVILGDVDGSGAIDTNDAREILKMASSIIPEDLSVADMNGDGVISVEDSYTALLKASYIGEIVIPEKNGDNILSDDPDNEFIRIVADTYGVEEEALVAIYSVPDSGTNYVLQFKGKGRPKVYEKSPDNLEIVYLIGVAPERAISYTNGEPFLGKHYNCTAAEGVLVFNLIKTKVMAQHPDYFVGVEA